MAFEQIVTKSPFNKNYAYEVIVSNCGINESTGYTTIGISYGKIQIKSINVTNNKCRQHSSINLNVDGNECLCQFSTFIDNNQSHVSNDILKLDSLRIGTEKNVTIFKYCDIIRNEADPYDDSYIFYCIGTTNVTSSNFLHNYAKYLFNEDQSNYILTVSNSFIESNCTTSTGNVTITSSKNKYSTSITNSSFYTQNCFFDPIYTHSNNVYQFQNKKYLRR